MGNTNQTQIVLHVIDASTKYAQSVLPQMSETQNKHRLCSM